MRQTAACDRWERKAKSNVGAQHPGDGGLDRRDVRDDHDRLVASLVDHLAESRSRTRSSSDTSDSPPGGAYAGSSCHRRHTSLNAPP